MAEELQAFTPAKPQKPTLGGTAHRGFIELKAALTSGDEHAILSECERGEDYAVEAFKDALSQDLPQGVCKAIKSQSLRILETHNKVRELRDSTQAGS